MTPLQGEDDLVRVEGLTVRYDRAIDAAVDNVSFSIPRASTLGIVGESGSGKSTLCLALLGLLPPKATRTGSFGFGTHDLFQLSPRKMREFRGRDIGLVYQDPMAALNPVRSVGAQVCEPLRIHRKMSRRDAYAEAARLLDRVGVADARRALDKYPFELSGGQQQRASIAMAISCSPSLIIADEPTTALDVTVQAQVLSLLEELRDELSLTMVFISHDLSVVASVADDILVMRNGLGVEYGSVRDVLARPSDAYTQSLVSSLLSMEDFT